MSGLKTICSERNGEDVVRVEWESGVWLGKEVQVRMTWQQVCSRGSLMTNIHFISLGLLQCCQCPYEQDQRPTAFHQAEAKQDLNVAKSVEDAEGFHVGSESETPLECLTRPCDSTNGITQREGTAD